ncbi:MAG: hypothetical protein CMJ20_00655 [Phycisphaeraceae bacterium]|nr:hypothetical protein [Phycisphaeraceae bacterium]
MCKEITFLPGDIISLGTAGKTLRIPANTKLLPDAAITAEIAGLGEFSIGITDRRTLDKTNQPQSVSVMNILRLCHPNTTQPHRIWPTNANAGLATSVGIYR